jgi:peroxiredoxin
MTIAVTLARVLLILVFVVAAAAKLARRSQTVGMLRAFGVPATVAGPLARILPVAEMAVAVALISSATARYGAAAAVALFTFFTLGMAINLAVGRKPDCNCFGALASAPIGFSTVLRNLALLSIGLFLIWQLRNSSGAAVGFTIGPSTLGSTALTIALIEAWGLLQIIAQNGRLLSRLDELERQAGRGSPSRSQLSPGSAAPAFSLPDLAGEELTLDTLLGGRKLLLLFFVDVNCGPCHRLIASLSQWERDLESHADVAIVASGNAASIRRLFGRGQSPVLMQREHELADAYRIYSTPSAVLILPDGTIAGPVAEGPEAIRALVGVIENAVAVRRPSQVAVVHANS